MRVGGIVAWRPKGHPDGQGRAHPSRGARPKNLRALQRAALDYARRGAADLEHLAALLSEPLRQERVRSALPGPGLVVNAP
jgi:hypothetical protein